MNGYVNKAITQKDDGLVFADLSFNESQPRSRAPILDFSRYEFELNPDRLAAVWYSKMESTCTAYEKKMSQYIPRILLIFVPFLRYSNPFTPSPSPFISLFFSLDANFEFFASLCCCLQTYTLFYIELLRGLCIYNENWYNPFVFVRVRVSYMFFSLPTYPHRSLFLSLPQNSVTNSASTMALSLLL